MKVPNRNLSGARRSRPPDLPGVAGPARLDRRTKTLARRLQPGDIAIIDHADLDRVSAEALISCQVAAVVNAAPSISGRYPNLGPQVLIEAGIPLVDDVGPGGLRPGPRRPGRPARRGRPVHRGGRRRQGHRSDRETVAADMASAKEGLAEQLGRSWPTPWSTSTATPTLLTDGIRIPSCGPGWTGGTRWSWRAATGTARTCWPCAPTSASSSRS